jgi:hypothetical protein
MQYVVQFHADLAKQLNQQVALAKRIWHEALPTLQGIRIAAGNYAGYGGYLARCHAGGIVEIPIGNARSLLEFDKDNQLVHAYADERQLLGTLLHEIGHHVVNTAQHQPWSGNIQVGSSTHHTAAWVWICCTGWNHVSGTSINPHEFARAVKQDKEMGRWLHGFNPHFPPPPVASLKTKCLQCEELFKPKRSDSKYCSTKCRVTAFRASNG